MELDASIQETILCDELYSVTDRFIDFLCLGDAVLLEGKQLKQS